MARLLSAAWAGEKHERRIELEAWQREIVRAHPEELIRGLIHSDGCRCIATINCRGHTYRYARSYFSNKSEDIKEAIFCEHLDLLGVAWTRPGDAQIQIARREVVERLDELIGPKS